MICLGWNCRRLGNPRSVNALRNLVQRWDPMIVFLSETKVRKSGMKRIKRKLENYDGLIVPSDGQSGGIAMLWKKDINLNIMGY